MVRFLSYVFVAISVGIFAYPSAQYSFAQVMQSGNFKIQSDSMNFGGGLSTSTNFMSESTFGEVASGKGTSSNYQLFAGYQQMQEVYIALSGATNVIMSPTISGVTGGVANGSSTVTVITDSPSGYSLSIASENSPAMQGPFGVINNYAPALNPDYTFVTGASDAHFGFSPEGVDIVLRFKDNGSVCNTGTLRSVNTCWDGLATSTKIIATATFPNHPLGATTTISFRVGIGNGVAQAPGVYSATTTVTALPL